jgi:hypothetical protein
MVVYCRRRKIRCLPPVGEGDRCQNCARQQRECVVQPIAGSTRKGGRNQANALSTDPMPYAEALSMTRQAQHNNTLAHRRGSQKSPSDRFHDHGYFSNTIAIPSYGYAPGSVGVPMTAPAHFASPSFLPPGHHVTEHGYGQDGSRRPPFKHNQSAPGSVYTINHPFERTESFRPTTSQEGYPGWQSNPGHPHYTGVPPQETFHAQGQDISSDPSNPFWKLNGASLTSPAADVALPPPRPNQWVPNANSNYTHERPNSSVTLPAPHNALGESSTFQSQPAYYTPVLSAPIGHVFQTPTQASPHPSHGEEHCEPNAHWPRTAATTSGYRSSGSS